MITSMFLIGILCGNLGAAIVPPFNLGLWWNSVCGAVGAAIVAFGPDLIGISPITPWYYSLLVTGAAGGGAMILCGGLAALKYRN